jgi:hypothetical protein
MDLDNALQRDLVHFRGPAADLVPFYCFIHAVPYHTVTAGRRMPAPAGSLFRMDAMQRFSAPAHEHGITVNADQTGSCSVQMGNLHVGIDDEEHGRNRIQQRVEKIQIFKQRVIHRDRSDGAGICFYPKKGGWTLMNADIRR